MIRKIFAARITLEQTQMQRDITIGQIYLQLLGNRTRVPWKSLIFANNARPKAIVTMWLQIQNKLPTTDRLSAWGMDIEQHCKLCQGNLESRDHLFVFCEFTRAIWEKLMAWINRPLPTAATWDIHLNWAIRQAKGKDRNAQLFKLMYAECAHAVWIERN